VHLQLSTTDGLIGLLVIIALLLAIVWLVRHL
jgi:flagellar biogenesis protein FliO